MLSLQEFGNYIANSVANQTGKQVKTKCLTPFRHETMGDVFELFVIHRYEEQEDYDNHIMFVALATLSSTNDINNLISYLTHQIKGC